MFVAGTGEIHHTRTMLEQDYFGPNVYKSEGVAFEHPTIMFKKRTIAPRA